MKLTGKEIIKRGQDGLFILRGGKKALYYFNLLRGRKKQQKKMLREIKKAEKAQKKQIYGNKAPKLSIKHVKYGGRIFFAFRRRYF